MENETLFIAFLVTWTVCVSASHIWAWRKGLPVAGVITSHAAPSAVVAVMTYVFLIGGGATVAQFVAGSESGMDLWSLWFHLWPVLLFITGASAFGSFVWTIIACVKKPHRKWIPVAIASLLMSAFAFVTVGANFPDA